MRCRIVLTIVMAMVLVAVVSPRSGIADEMPVRFSARVSWVAADTMVVSTADSPAVSVNLSQVPQDEYQRLTTGTYVIVTGTIEWRRIVAISIETVEP